VTARELDFGEIFAADQLWTRGVGPVTEIVNSLAVLHPWSSRMTSVQRPGHPWQPLKGLSSAEVRCTDPVNS
jgi:hypothetical protein